MQRGEPIWLRVMSPANVPAQVRSKSPSSQPRKACKNVKRERAASQELCRILGAERIAVRACILFNSVSSYSLETCDGHPAVLGVAEYGSCPAPRTPSLAAYWTVIMFQNICVIALKARELGIEFASSLVNTEFDCGFM